MTKYKLPKIEELFDAGVHFGHQIRRWNPNMEKYIFAERSGIHIIDLDTSHEGLKNAADFLFEVASRGDQIIFVGTKRQAREIIKAEATRAGALFVNQRWLGGTITNFDIISKNMTKLTDYRKKRDEGEFAKYTKKEQLLLDREIEKLENSVGGIIGFNGKPGAVFVVDSKREKTVVSEANIRGVPVVGLIDTNSDPRVVDYVIPGNDDAIRAIAAVVKVVADAVESGYAEYAKHPPKVEEVEEGEKEGKQKDEKKPVKKKMVKKKIAKKDGSTSSPPKKNDKK